MSTPEVVKRRASVQRPDGEERLRELRRDLEYERLLGDDDMAGALMYGANSREDRIMQMDALVEMQRKIFRRGSTAHAIVLSANVLTMAVMASQLAMFRWKVTEAQTLTEATASIQHQVMRAQKCGFTVRRVAATTSTRDSEKEKFRRKDSFVCAHAAEERTDLIPADEKRKAAPATDAASRAPAVGAEHMQHVRDSEDNARPVSPPSSVCSAESEAAVRKPPPDDMVAQLVVVDTFTHEPFSDIVDHLRYFDRENSLGLVIVLMLHDNYENHSPGMVILPKHTTTVSEAYSLGYDLVLRRCFDHTVVKLFTEVFMSAKGRWCKEMHSKGIVGNYHGMRHILLEQDDVAPRNGVLSVPDVDECSNNGSDDMGPLKNFQGSYMSSTLLSSTLASLPPRLSTMGVRGALASAPNQRMHQIHSIFNVKDILTNVMSPSKSVKHATKRLLRPSNSIRDFLAGGHGGEIENGYKNDENAEKIYEDALVDEKEEVESAVVAAYKQEILRLVTELECSERTVALLKNEVAQLGERKSSDTNSGAQSPFTSNSYNDSGPENFISVSKEQQVITLRQRLASVTDKLMAYEMQNNNRTRKRNNWLQDNRISASPITTPRRGTISPEGDAQDVFSNTATTTHGVRTMESSLLERTGTIGERTLNLTHSQIFSPDVADDGISNLCSEIASLLQERKRSTREMKLRVSEMERLEDKNVRMATRLADAMETILVQKELIAELEERLQQKNHGEIKLKSEKGGKKRGEKDLDDDGDGDGGRPHGGASIGRNAKAKRKKQETPAAVARVSTWVKSVPSCTSTRAPSAFHSADLGEREQMRGARPTYPYGETGKRSPPQAAQKQQRKTEMQEQSRPSPTRPNHLQKQGHVPLKKTKYNNESMETDVSLTKLKSIFNDIVATNASGDQDLGEKARAQARVVAREYAVRQMKANGGEKAPQEVEIGIQEKSDDSVERLRHAHMEAVKTSEDILNRGEDSEAFAQAIISVIAIEQELHRGEQNHISQAVTEATGKAVTLHDDAKTVEGSAMVDSNGKTSGVGSVVENKFLQKSTGNILQGIESKNHGNHGKERQNQKEPKAEGSNGAKHGSALQTAAVAGAHDGDVADARSNFLNELYLEHHQALMRFLQLVGNEHATLRQVLQDETDELVGKIEAEIRRLGGEVETHYLVSIDTALLSRLAALLDGAERSFFMPSARKMRLNTLAFNGSSDTTDTRRDTYSLRESVSPEDVANLLSRQDVTVDDIPPWLIELLERADDEFDPALQEDPAATEWVKKVLAKVDTVRKKRGKELTELLRQRRENLMRARAEASQRSNMSGDVTGECDSNDSVVGVMGAEETEALFVCHPSLQRVFSPSLYGHSLPPGKPHAVLRRRSLLGKNVLFAEPNGDVRTEVSKRLLKIQCSSTKDALEGDSKFFSVLPPVGLRGLSRRQQAQFQTMHGAPNLLQPREPPRDAALAPENVRRTATRGASRIAATELDQSPFSPEELAGRIMAYRPAFPRHEGTARITARMTAAYPTFAIPVAAASMPPLSSGTAGERGGPLQHPHGALESYVSWVYGVPSELLFPMLRGAAPEESDAVLFLPACAYTEKDGGNATHCIQTSFVRRMLARMDLFSSPATLAARRLNAQLQMSMSDWRMGVVGRAITPAPRGNHTPQQKKI
ncbi:hypothetical protein C3747_122g70 [Trypanosoma cruzi]|uniref:Uncharacterized protein n=1 Tax=Trypanosoma cruzi TaxID=5693 RepID=A0A2V2WBE3_TRYCR|nr:hypothetical protein C3747_122g70 [Trypanosoma cruzi]